MCKFMIEEALQLFEEYVEDSRVLQQEMEEYSSIEDGCFEDWSNLYDWEADWDYPEIAYQFQEQYESAISRTSDYVNDHIYAHLCNQNGALVHRYKSSFVAGFKSEGIFILSHFAPYSLREGMEHLKVLQELPFKVLIAVPEYQAQMLIRLGFDFAGITYQFFGGELVEKQVLTNFCWKLSEFRKLQNMLKNNEFFNF